MDDNFFETVGTEAEARWGGTHHSQLSAFSRLDDG